MLRPAVQDVESITDPSGSLVKVNSVALILWDIFDARYGSGVGAVLLMLLPLGCSCFSALHTVTSASRYPSDIWLIFLLLQGSWQASL